jgi:hypothetical protein
MHRSKVPGKGRFWLQFLAQAQNVVVDRASTRITLVSPDFIEKFIPGDYSSSILEEIGKSLELLEREGN